MKMVYVIACAATLCTGSRVAAADRSERSSSDERATFGDLGGFFREFDTLFDDMYGLAGDAAQRTETFFSQGADDIFKRMRKESARVHQRATEGMRAMRLGSLEVLKKAQASMKKDIEALNNLAAEMDQNIKSTKSFAQVSIKESGDETDYTILVTLPGYDEKNIKVTVSTKDVKAAGAKKQLRIDATKVGETRREVKEKDKTMVAMRTEQMYSSSIVGDRKQEISLKDGVLKIICDLPADADEEDYKMTLNGDVLSIQFPKTKKAHAEIKSLSFSNTNSDN